MPDLCPKGIDLGVKPSAPSCPPTLPPILGLQTGQTEGQGISPGMVGLVSVTTQTEIQTAQVEVQTNPVSVRPQSTLVSIETQTIDIREAQTAKTKGEIQDEMENRRQREKEKQISPIYPWDRMRRAAREAEEQPHKLLPLHETPTRRNNQSIRVNKPFSYQEIQRIKEEDGGGTGWGDHFLPHKFIERIFEHQANSTEQLLNAGRGHQAPRKAAHCLRKEVGQNIKREKR